MKDKTTIKCLEYLCGDIDTLEERFQSYSDRMEVFLKALVCKCDKLEEHINDMEEADIKYREILEDRFNKIK